jgi:hypothetical protein
MPTHPQYEYKRIAKARDRDRESGEYEDQSIIDAQLTTLPNA